MKRFFLAYNNGVAALAPEHVILDAQKAWDVRRAIEGMGSRGDSADRLAKVDAARLGVAHVPNVPIFTFVDNERFKGQPWFTGTTEELAVLRTHILSTGAEIISEGRGYVPFSNGMEMGYHGVREMEDELRFVTTELQFVEEFGVTMRELLGK